LNNIWNSRYRARTILVYFVLGIAVLLILGPLFLIVLTAFKTEREVSLGAFTLPGTLRLDNFVSAWTNGLFGLYFKSSVIVVIPVVVVSTVFSVMAGYALGMLKPPGHRMLFGLFLVGIAVPFEGMIVPLYYRLNAFKMINTYWALILPQIAMGVAIGAFWFQAFFMSIPRELVDASVIDGADHWKALWLVLFPLSRPALLSFVILSAIWTWNEFLLVIVMATKDSIRTLPVGLALFHGAHKTQIPLSAAGAIIVALPMVILFTIFQRDFIRGMTSGSIRG
jgi:raffinose/stachyose/melibiose transport system permease protein